MEAVISQNALYEWYSLAMTPLGVPMDTSTLYHPSVDHSNGSGTSPERHNVDKNMLAQDLALISVEIVIKARIATAKAFATVLALWPSQEPKILPADVREKEEKEEKEDKEEKEGKKAKPEKPDTPEYKIFDDLFRPLLAHYVDSPSMLQKFMTAVIVEEWAHKYEDISAIKATETGEHIYALIANNRLARELGVTMGSWLQSDPPVAYHEMSIHLSRIHGDCGALLQSFAFDCKIPQTMIPVLSPNIDINGTAEGGFNITVAERVVGPIFTELKTTLGRSKKKEVINLQDKRLRIESSIKHYNEVKVQHDVRVSAAFACAYVALKHSPNKVSPIVKGIMNGIKACIFSTNTSSPANAFLPIRAKRTSTCKHVPLSLSPRSLPSVRKRL